MNCYKSIFIISIDEKNAVFVIERFCIKIQFFGKSLGSEINKYFFKPINVKVKRLRTLQYVFINIEIKNISEK